MRRFAQAALFGIVCFSCPGWGSETANPVSGNAVPKVSVKVINSTDRYLKFAASPMNSVPKAVLAAKQPAAFGATPFQQALLVKSASKIVGWAAHISANPAGVPPVMVEMAIAGQKLGAKIADEQNPAESRALARESLCLLANNFIQTYNRAVEALNAGELPKSMESDLGGEMYNFAYNLSLGIHEGI